MKQNQQGDYGCTIGLDKLDYDQSNVKSEVTQGIEISKTDGLEDVSSRKTRWCWEAAMV